MVLVLLLLVPIGIVFATLMGLLYLFGFDLLTFNLIYIIPVGAFISSCLMFVFFGEKCVKKEINTKKFTLLVLILSVSLFIGIQYGQYKMTYIDDTDGMNYKMKGNHVSEYINPDTEDGFTFLSYVTFSINHSSISFSRRMHTLIKLDGVKIINWIIYIISFIGFLIGSMAGLHARTTNLAYCDHCKKYMKRIPFSLSNNFSKEKISVLEERIKSSESIIDHLEAHPALNKATALTYYKLHLLYCESCKNGIVNIQRFKLNDKSKYVSDELEKEIKVDPIFVTEHLDYTLNKINEVTEAL